MAFKFGLTVMNCLQPNLPENFDLVATMEAFDTYNKLKIGIFQHYETELHWLCALTDGHEPTIIVVSVGSDENQEVVPLLVEVFTGMLPPPMLHDCIYILLAWLFWMLWRMSHM